MGVDDQIKQAIQDLVARALHMIQGELTAARQRVDGLDQKIDGVDARLTIKIDSLRAEMIAEFRRADVRIDALEREVRLAIDIRERLAALEARRPA
jgi:hypothetical protein